MPPEIVPSDEEYNSSEDSDFAPDAAPAHISPDSDSDSEPEPGEAVAATKPAKKRKRTEEDVEAEDLGFENSGDEAIIGDGLKEKRKRREGKKGKGKLDEDEDEGGEGGFVKTRSMRAIEEVKKKPLADTTAATIDVDAVWAAMISGKPIAPPEPKMTKEVTILSPQSPSSKRPASASDNPETNKVHRSPSTFGDGPDSMILIKRTYTFAGKVHTEQKLVPKNSAEARLYLSSQPDASSKPDAEEKGKEKDTPSETPTNPLFTKPKRPLKLARRSIFEPVIDNLPQRKDLHFGVRRTESGIALVQVRTGKEKKLNTVEKSAMDWAGFVDKEGIKDELDAAGKSKGAYKARQEFLARVEAKKVEDERRARGLPVL